MLESNIMKENWNTAYSSVITDETLWGEDYVPYLDNVITMFKEIEPLKVLDFPCGDGRNSLLLAKNFQNIVCADSSENALKMLSLESNKKCIKNLLEINTDLFASCFVPDEFDAILCWDVLGHLDNPEAAISELIRICRPDGLIVGSFFSNTDPCTLDGAMEKLNDTDYYYRKQYFYRLYDKQMLVDLLSTFIDIEVQKIDHTIWKEPPHEGFREYPHEHHSWAVAMRKRGRE
jgi:ubiquinone/menaquinone biosynthesis C-methylase UbiE